MLQVVASPTQKVQKTCWRCDCNATNTTMTVKSLFVAEDLRNVYWSLLRTCNYKDRNEADTMLRLHQTYTLGIYDALFNLRTYFHQAYIQTWVRQIWWRWWIDFWWWLMHWDDSCHIKPGHWPASRNPISKQSIEEGQYDIN